MKKGSSRLQKKATDLQWIPVASSAGNSATRSFDYSTLKEEKVPEFSLKKSVIREFREQPHYYGRILEDIPRSGLKCAFVDLNRNNSAVKSGSKGQFIFSELKLDSLFGNRTKGYQEFESKDCRIEKQITPFDDIYMNGHTPADQEFLQKRRPGRPKKNGGEPMHNPEKKLHINNDSPYKCEKMQPILEQDTYSDSGEQYQNLTEEQIFYFEKEPPIAFGPVEELKEIPMKERSNITKQYNLDFKKLIDYIEKLNSKNKVARFICRFCGKAFDKPSSLGGHTAKTHNGMSIKYKTRVAASLNRKAERSRNQFLKHSAEENLKG